MFSRDEGTVHFLWLQKCHKTLNTALTINVAMVWYRLKLIKYNCAHAKIYKYSVKNAAAVLGTQEPGQGGGA